MDASGKRAPSKRPLAAPSTVTQPGIDNIAEDDICPVCHLLLCRPVTTLCNHTLCESCMAAWADVSIANQMQIVDVDEEPVAFDPVTGLEARCPMCRTQTKARFNQFRAQRLRDTYSRLYTEREAEESVNLSNRDAGDIQSLTLYIGNTHRLIEPPAGSNNIHEWTFFVRPSKPEVCEEVQIHLHPSFRPNRVICTRQPYSITRKGWGFFTIVANVMLKAGYSWMSEDAEDSPDGAEKGMLALEWLLDFRGFEGRGSMGQLRLKVRNQRSWQVDGEQKDDDRAWQRLVRNYERDGQYKPPVEQD